MDIQEIIASQDKARKQIRSVGIAGFGPAKKRKAITRADVDVAVSAALESVAQKIKAKARHEPVMIFKSGLIAALSIVEEEMK